MNCHHLCLIWNFGCPVSQPAVPYNFFTPIHLHQGLQKQHAIIVFLTLIPYVPSPILNPSITACMHHVFRFNLWRFFLDCTANGVYQIKTQSDLISIRLLFASLISEHNWNIFEETITKNSHDSVFDSISIAYAKNKTSYFRLFSVLFLHYSVR